MNSRCRNSYRLLVGLELLVLSPARKSGPLPLRGVSSLIDVPKSPSLAHRKPRELSYTSAPSVRGVVVLGSIQSRISGLSAQIRQNDMPARSAAGGGRGSAQEPADL